MRLTWIGLLMVVYIASLSGGFIASRKDTK